MRAEKFRPWKSSREWSFAADRVDERPEWLDLDFDGVAVTQEAALGGANAGHATARRIVPEWAPCLDADLVATLRAFAANELNAARTAPALHVHPNTVRRRLDRVLALTGRDARRFLDLVDLLAAVALS